MYIRMYTISEYRTCTVHTWLEGVLGPTQQRAQERLGRY